MVVGCYDIGRRARPANLESRVLAGNNTAVILAGSQRRRPIPGRSRRASSSALSGALRWLALCALLVATPVVQQALTEVIQLLAADDCGCEHDREQDCKEQGDCPGTCQTCLCCPHSNVVSVAGLGVPVCSGLREPMCFEQVERDSEGYLSSPFRPPIG
jgi:hypothetical protein